MSTHNTSSRTATSRAAQRFLDNVERLGNRLPDPAILFVWALLLTWVASAVLSPVEFAELDPRTNTPIRVISQLTGPALANFLSTMVKTFVEFPPLGLVLVALLGVGVAEHAGFVKAALQGLLALTPRRLLTPMLLLVAIISHVAGDTGYVLVIPLAAVMYLAAGRHPLLGITTSFAGVSGGFSACFVPSSLDPLLQGFTQSAAQIMDPERVVNPLCNWGFMSTSCLMIVGVGWYITDRVIEPRLEGLPLDERSNASDSATAVGASEPLNQLTPIQRRALFQGLATAAACLVALAVWAWPADSPLRATDGSLAGRDAPLMKAIVPLIFFCFLVPGVVYGVAAGTIRGSRDVVQAMTKSMGTMAYYLVMAFFASQFTAAFTQSNVGVLLAVKGANALAALHSPSQVTIVGIILLTASVNLLIGSASAKWALLSPIFVPMLMSLGLSPELTQAAYRIGDSSTNIITPLMPYFPLVVVYAQRYVKQAGVGTMISLMLPYSLAYLLCWTILLLVYWALGLPLGIQARYENAGLGG